MTLSGNLVTTRDHNGAMTGYGDDGNGEVNKITISGAVTTTSTSTDAFGQPTAMTNPDATLSLAWTLGGQLASETTPYTGTAIPDQTRPDQRPGSHR